MGSLYAFLAARIEVSCGLLVIRLFNREIIKGCKMLPDKLKLSRIGNARKNLLPNRAYQYRTQFPDQFGKFRDK